MKPTLTMFATAAGVTFITTPIIRRAMVRINSIDVPNHRSSHSAPVPRGGGLACTIAAVVTAAAPRQTQRLPSRATASISALSFLGFVDDQRRGLPASLRLTVQITAGLLAYGHPGPGALASGFAMPAVVNVFNFMDGINGISACTAVVWGCNAIAVSKTTETRCLALIGAIAAGSGLGFLPWNVRADGFFLGDVGSYFFGALIANGIIAVIDSPRTAISVAAPLTLYGADAAQALARRISRGAPATEAHREHIYQRLVDEAGLSHLTVTSIHTLLALSSSASWYYLRPRTAAAASVSVVVLYLISPSASRWIQA